MQSILRSVDTHLSQMMDGDKFLLKWDGFIQNITSSYANLRYENDFTDVTLISEDGELLKLHKVVLASSSDFFRNIFTKYNNSCPLIYMKGFRTKYLTSIIDFIYFGETNVDQEDLKMFLELSKELELKGIAEEENEESGENTKEQHKRFVDFKTEDTIANKENTQNMDAIDEIIKDTDGLQGDEIDKIIVETIEKLYNPKSYKCKICGKTESARNKTVLKRHIEKNHMRLVNTCHVCKKTFNVRSALQSHITYNHKDTKELPCPEIVKIEKNVDEHVESPVIVRQELIDDLQNTVDEMLEKLFNPRGYRCKVCGKTSGTKDKTNLKQHIEKEHIKIGKFPCGFCEKTFNLSYTLKAHERLHNKPVNVLIKSL